MAIDSIEGGNGNSYQSRRKSLDEQRERELGEIEKKYKDNVRKAEDSREQHLKEIYESQSFETEAARNEADARISTVKLAADNRIRQFEQEAQKMGEEAKRQYGSKARQLSKNAEELESQRKFMVKSHEEAMKQLSDNRNLSYLENQRKSNADNLRQQAEYRKNTDKIKTQGEIDLQMLQADLKNRTDRTLSEGDRKLREVSSLNQRELESLERQSQSNRLAEAEKLEHLRLTNSINESNIRSEAEARSMEVNRQSKSSVNQAMNKGQRDLEDTKLNYARQQFDTQKAAEKKIKEFELKKQIQVEDMNRQAALEHKMAQDGFLYKREQFAEASEKALNDQRLYNEKLNQELSSQSKNEGEKLRAEKQHLLTEMAQQYQADIRFNKAIGDRQLAQVTEKYSSSLEEHSAKSNADPFYRLQRVDATMGDTETELVVKVKVPQYEQSSVRLTYQGDKIVLSGTRRSENKALMADGRTAATNTYQSYSETMPVKGKLDMNRMSKSFEDGTLTFKIPKS